jgi:hypothetical protein
MTDLHALIRRMADELDHYRQLLTDDRTDRHPLATEARAVLARWGRPVIPPPPAAGEVGEVITALRAMAVDADSADQISDANTLDRAAALLSRQAAEPVPVAERLPEPNTKILAHYFNSHGKGRTICAIWVSAKSRSDSSGEEDFTEYDEETDAYYWPEGWYEVIENWDDLGYVKVYEGEVVYWQPLPKWPALPLPSGEVE